MYSENCFFVGGVGVGEWALPETANNKTFLLVPIVLLKLLSTRTDPQTKPAKVPAIVFVQRFILKIISKKVVYYFSETH